MRKLVWIAVAAALAWSGYWVLGAQGIERGLGAWFEARRAEGWQAEAREIATKGYPLGFETELLDVSLVDPATGLGWQTARFDFAARAHAPTRIDAVLPETLRVLTPLQEIEVDGARMTAALGLIPGPSLALESASVDLAGVTFTSSLGWDAALAAGALSTVRTEDDPLAHDILFSAEELRLARILRRALDPTGRLPEEIDRLELDVRAGFDAPWDRHVIEDRRPQPTALDLRLLRATWGEMLLEATGSLDVDGAGIPEGEVTVRAVNWREMLQVARASGALPENFVPTVESALRLLAGLSGNPNTIDAPLTFRDGRILIGFVPIARAPRITIR